MFEGLEATFKRHVTKGSLPYQMAKRVNYFFRDRHRDLRLIIKRKRKSSIFWSKAEMHSCSLFPQKKLDYVINQFGPKSVLDLGCGTGKALDYFMDRGIDATGVEGSARAISLAKHPQRIMQFDLNNRLELRRRFDLIWCFEVVEHIHPDYVENLLRSFVDHADVLVMSAAHPGQGGEGHFNEQWPEYWKEKLGGHGYACDEKATAELRAIDEIYSDNMLVFRKKSV